MYKSAEQIADTVLTKLATSRLAKFIRTAAPDDLLYYIEKLKGSASPTYYAMRKIMRPLRDTKGNLNLEQREKLLKDIRHRLTIPFYDEPILAPRTQHNLEYAKNFKTQTNTPLMRVAHGGAVPDLEQLLQHGPTSGLDHRVPTATGRLTRQGIYAHKHPHPRSEFYAHTGAGVAGGDPGILEFDLPQGILTTPNKTGGGNEWPITPDMWKYVQNPKIVKLQKKLDFYPA